MIKRQTLTAVICALLAAVLAIVYFAVIEPMLAPKEEKVTPIELIDPLEVRMHDQTRVYMFPPLGSKRIDRIEVHNDEGGYTFRYDKREGKFLIEGREDAPYDSTALSAILATMAAPVASERYLIDENTDLSVYGLAASDNPAYFIVTDDNDVMHKIWIGKKARSGDGYYCQYDERKAVYLVKTVGFEVFLSDVYGLMTPAITLQVPQNEYFEISFLRIFKNGAPIVEIKTLTPEQNGTDKTSKPTYSYEFGLNLKQYTPDATEISSTFNLLSGLSGSKVEAHGLDFVLGADKLNTDLLKTRFRIDIENPYYCIQYTYKSNDVQIYFSSPDEEGNCYAFTTAYYTVVKMPFDSLRIYRYEAYDFIEKNIIAENIVNVSKIEIKGSIIENGNRITVDSAYGLKSTPVEGTEQTVQTVWDIKKNKDFTVDEVANFKRLYYDIISLDRENDDIDVSKITDAEHIASVTVTLTSGTAKTVDFYAINSTTCYFTVNGSLGDYALLTQRDNVEKLIRDTYNFDLGYTIDSNI